MKVTAIDIGSRLELFVDEALIDRTVGAELRLHHPVPREIALIHDALWEGNSCGYYTVFQDGDLYKMYYRGGEQVLKGEPTAHPSVTCFAQSADGIHWSKPDLQLIEYAGSKRNNIVHNGRGADSFAPFRDANPARPGGGIFKAVGGGKGPDGKPALFAFQSADGLRWSPVGDGPVATQGMFDSQNLAFWDRERGQYRAYWRAFRDPATDEAVEAMAPASVRDIVTATSDDFLHWSDPVWLRYPGVPDEELYTNQVIPYFRAPHIFLGFPTRYLDRGWSDSMRSLPGLEHRKQRSATSEREGTALTDGLFMSSRDGRSFKRWREAFIRPGLRSGSNWVYGDNYQAWGMVTTKSMMEEAPDELSFFASENYWMPGGSRLRRFTLRVDGFVSVQAPARGAEMVTRPLVFSGDRLMLNFSTSAAGSVRVEIRRGDGQPAEGHALEDCAELFGDELERVVTWKKGADVGTLAGQVVTLRFAMQDADLYSMRFSPVHSSAGPAT